MDVLTDSLRRLQLETEVYGRLELGAPWGIELATGQPGYFHAVTRGGCWLEVGFERRALAAGDWVFLLGGAPHVLRDAPGSRIRPLPELYAETGAQCGGVLRHGGDGVRTTLVSFSFGFDGSWLNPALRVLPRLLHVQGDGLGSSRWMEAIVQLVAAEMEAGRPGHEIVARRLADVLFVHALRAHLQAAPAEQGGWLRALEDPRLGPALQRMHERPEQRWTVDALARVAGMSRSTFAARFQDVVGDSPLAYLTRWRMHTAIQRMKGSDEPLSAIASAVGYETESAFGKAFRKQIGVPPGTFRKTHR
jgi:AraC-like DNA-binding protein